METRLLRSFLAVAYLESFTSAAAELGYTQSTVTSHVQKLERQLRSRVLDRLPNGVRTTELGSRLVPMARELLAAEDRLCSLPSENPPRPAGTVKIMAPESLCTYRLPAVIRAVRAAEPMVQVWVSPGGVNAALDAVHRGSVDMALTMEPRLPETNLALERLGAERLTLLEHPTTGTAEATWADLARRDALLVEEGCGYSDEVVSHLGATGNATGKHSRFGSVEAIKRCVAVGLGWTALPAATVDGELQTGSLKEIHGPRLPDCDVHLVTQPRRDPSPASEVVLAAAREPWRRTPRRFN